jgi:hypothetical protein
MGVADSMSKKHRISFIAVSLMAVSLLPAAKAQENNNSKPEEAATSAIAKKVINLWPGVAPGSEQWKQPEANFGSGPFRGQAFSGGAFSGTDSLTPIRNAVHFPS